MAWKMPTNYFELILTLSYQSALSYSSSPIDLSAVVHIALNEVVEHAMLSYECKGHAGILFETEQREEPRR